MKLKTAFWLFLLLATLFTSCSSDDSDSLFSEESLEKKLTGNWYYSEDNEIYSFFIKGDGTGYVDLYEYLSKEWKTEKSDLQYTLSDKNLVINIKPDYTWSGTIGITGNSLSLTSDDETIMMTKFDGSTATINKLKKEIEDEWLEVVPNDTIGEEVFWNSEENLQMFISGIYSSLRSFECNQINLEHIRLTGKTLQGSYGELTPCSGIVSTTWESADRVIQMTNMIIDHLEDPKTTYLSEKNRIAYLNEAILIRSFMYYNLAHLWGQVPYVDKVVDHTEIRDIPIYTQDEIFSLINADLKKIHSVVGRKYYMNNDVAVVLQAEIALWQNDKVKALQLLKDCKAAYSVPILGNDIYHKLFGDELCIYSEQVIDLLIQEAEAKGNNSNLLTDWKSFKSQWGYWAMLKRTQQAQAVAGCKEHEILMPIPQREIDNNPNMTQNPGYK